jgi:tetratricopeptide (TPR) repeat protein
MCAALCLAVVCRCADSPLRASPDVATRALIAAGHWKQARAVLEPRVKANPSDAEAAALLSSVRLAYGNPDAALSLAEIAVKLEPKSADYHWQLAVVVGEMAQRANIFKQIGLGRRFRLEAETAIALDPTQIEARIGMISFYIQAPGIIGGDRRKADQMADEIARIDPAAGALAKARILLETRMAGNIEGLYRQAFDATQKPDVKLDVGAQLMDLYLSQKPPRLDAAEQQAQAMIAIDPHRAGPYTGLAIVYASSRRLTDLDALLANAEKMVPDNFGPFYEAARALFTQGGDVARAERFLRKYLTIEPEAGAPGLAQAHWRLGLVLEMGGRRADAASELEQAIKLQPDFEDAKKDLKRLKSGIGRR